MSKNALEGKGLMACLTIYPVLILSWGNFQLSPNF